MGKTLALGANLEASKDEALKLDQDEMSEVGQRPRPSRTLTEAEFCELVGISRTTAWQLRQTGQLPYCRLGTKILYLPEHAEELLRRLEHNIERFPGSGERGMTALERPSSGQVK